MNIRVLDFETYYDKDFSLSKMTVEEYIRDSRFEVVGFAYQDFDENGSPIMGEPMWVTGDEAHIREYLTNVMQWDDVALCAHNAMFDAAILTWNFGVVPTYIYDTLSMARPRFNLTVGGSLKAVAKALGAGVKGTEVLDALGKRRLDFSPEELHRYAEYCRNDVALTADIFFKLRAGLPQSELDVIDLMIRMFSEPVLELDKDMLVDGLTQVREQKTTLLKDAFRTATANPKFAKKVLELKEKGKPLQSILSSNPMFRMVIEALGYECPMKTSPTTGKQIPALGKKDPEFLAFEEAHPDDEVLQALIAARKGTKSTLMESRIERFIGIAERGPMPVPLLYYGAHTGRASGSDKLNFQNMPRGSVLRHAIKAPAEHQLVVADSGQIEARGVAWVAGETELLNTFARGDDVYKWMASKIYNKAPEDIEKSERQVGKIAVLGLGYGMGANKYKDTLKAMTGIDLPAETCQRVVETYRTANPNIAAFWQKCDNALRSVAQGVTVDLGPNELCPLTFHPAEGDLPVRIDLPNGMTLDYPGFEYNAEDKSFVYYRRKGKAQQKKYLWGGVITENIVQAIARIIVFDQMLTIQQAMNTIAPVYGGHWRTALTVHDEVVLVVPTTFAQTVLNKAIKVMRTPSAWATGWPLDAEGDVAERYGEAK